MGETVLKKRIEDFRRDYLETASGRAHYETGVSESKEVQSIYDDLQAKRKAGADITDEVLKRLLPHSNTQGNRQRGVRVSTWPCITKNVRSWFEGAGWKEPHEWPEAALWLLDIVNAGASENWTEWRKLAQQPIQRGFACGFISPIVHCLKPGLPVVNSKVVKTYAHIASALGIKDEISSSLVDYPENSKKVLKLVRQLSTLGIKELREFDIYCHWNIDKRLGGGGEPPPPPPPPPPPVDTLCKELQKSQSDTQNPERFEAAVAAALEALGCDAEHIGGSGDADVFADVPLGEDRFSFVVDAKTCQAGGTKASINYQPLKKHQELHQANYAVVIAPSFASGDTVGFAKERQIGLLTTDTLVALLKYHAAVGLSLYDLKEILSAPGVIVIDPPLEIRCKTAQDRLDVMRGVLQAFEAYHRREESSAGLDAKAVYFLLKGERQKFTQEQVEHAVDLLANPMIGVLEKRGSSFVLTLPANAANARFALYVGVNLASGQTSAK